MVRSGDAVETKKIILFGASGKCADVMKKYLANTKINLQYICDNDKNKHGSYFHDIIVESPKKLYQEEKEDIIVICTSSYYPEIAKQLSDANIYCYNSDSISTYSSIQNNSNQIKQAQASLSDNESKRIFNIIIEKRLTSIAEYSDICIDNQYFLKELYYIGEDEVFVDCGAYDGDTISRFLMFTNGKYKKIHAFEPSPDSYSLLKKAYYKYNNIQLYNKGVHNSNSILHFSINPENMAGSCINEEGTSKIEVVKLDDVIKEKVTFIKMDVEGSELDALEGARNIIETYMPKLSICIYHELEDLWEIPLWVKNINPNYKTYIRHHANNFWETVLYATI